MHSIDLIFALTVDHAITSFFAKQREVYLLPSNRKIKLSKKQVCIAQFHYTYCIIRLRSGVLERRKGKGGSFSKGHL